MSYDMYISDEEFNYTYNVSGMWYSAEPEYGIRTHYGLTGEEALPVLRGIREHMEDNREDLLKLNPENGWGDYDGALQFVTDLINASVRHRDCVWSGD